MTKPFALIIEDDEMLATFFTAAFRDAEYETHAILDGAQALIYLQTQHVPEIILLDLQLPHVSGEELLTFIKSQSKFADTMVFVASVEGVRVSYLEEQADIMLTKPVAYRQLRDLAVRMHPHEQADPGQD